MLNAPREGEPSVDADALESLADVEDLELVEDTAHRTEALDPSAAEPLLGQAAGLEATESAAVEPGPVEPGPVEPGPVAPDSRERVTHPVHVHATAAPPRPEAGAMPDHGATAPQLRRFIKSRAYVPMHELRRRFAINGGDDDVTAVEVERQRVYVGLPEREGRLLGELLRGGDIGVELSLDPIAPIVVGIYPIRPIPRT